MSAVGAAKLPAGNLPRVPLSWVYTEAVCMGRRELVLGNSLCDFMARLGINNDGGDPGRRLRSQMERLFSSAISLHFRGDCKSVRPADVIADKAIFWSDYDRPEMDSLAPSEIRLSRPFFDSIARQPGSFDLNCLLRFSPREQPSQNSYLVEVHEHCNRREGA